MRSISNREKIYCRTNATFRKVPFVLSLAMLFFLSASISAQVLSNRGAVISVTGGAVVDGDTIENVTGKIENAGTINLSGHYINMATTSGNGFYNIKGNWVNSGTFLPGTSSVQFRGEGPQDVVNTGTGNFYKMIINNTGSPATGRIILLNDIMVSDTLEMDQGIVQTGSNKLFLRNPLFSSLIYTSGRIIGKFERGVNSPNNYLFPIGSNSNYNPLNLKPNVPAETDFGSVLSEFIPEEPDTLGLPIPDTSVDPGVEVYNVIKDGYWSLKSNNGFSITDFNVDIDGAGFSDPNAVQEITRVIKREAGADWLIDGVHSDADGNVAFRNNLTGNISASVTQLGLGNVRPLIIQQPKDTAVCDGTEAQFSVVATGVGTLYYQWHEKPPHSGWRDLTDQGIYSGTQTATLTISSADLTMDQYQYRVRVSHKYGHVNWTRWATLLVDSIPAMVATPESATICNNESTFIELSSDVAGTSYNWFILSEKHLGAFPDSTDIEAGTIQQPLYNPGDNIYSVKYGIVPRGPSPTFCVGSEVTAVVAVNPTPNILVKISNDMITSDTVFCNGFEVDFEQNNYQLTSGTVKYHLEVTGDAGTIHGESPNTDSLGIANFTNTLSHTDSQIRELNYRFIPYIENAYGTTGCYSGVDTTVNVKIVPVLTAIEAPAVLDPGFFNITCHGLSDGEIVLTPQGGDLRYTYEINWKNESGNPLQTEQATYGLIDELSAGIYEYAVTDTIGCFFSDTILLIEPDTLAIDSYNIVSPQCYGDDPTGEVHVDLSGGVKTSAVYKAYEWEHALIERTVGTGEDLNGVISGPFNFTFIDHYNCSFDTMFIIPPANRLDSDTLTISEYGNFQISCNGASDGSVEVIGLGGAGSDTGTDTYTYKWYDENKMLITNTSSIENVEAGTYYYWLKDANGCLLGVGLAGDSLVALELTEPDSITFIRDTDDLHPGGWDISCFGRSDGEINLQYLGGHTEYMDNTFSWSGDISSTDSILAGRSAGSYSVEVTDAFGCTGETTFTLQQPPLITYDTVMSGFAGLNNVSCFGRSDGFIDLNNVSGGGTKDTPGIYSYDWIPPSGVALDDETQQDQDSLPVGRYYFTITDQIGCSVSDSAEIVQPDSLFAVPANSLRNGYEISCFNGSDGWVSLEPSGGTRPYSYAWSDETVSTTDTAITLLNAGYYSVTITDPNGCENFYEWELQHPDTIVLNPDPSRLIECFGDTSRIVLSPEGGVGGYSYMWEGGVTSRDLTGVSEGTYHVLVTDVNGCVISDSIYLGQRSRIMPEIVVRSDFNGRHISCYGAENAAIELVVTGGNDSNYAFEWNTSAGDINKYNLSGLPAGIYSVSGEDASGCEFDTVKQVIQPADINVIYTAKEPLCEGNENGSISISVVGGTPMTGSPIYNYSLNGEEFLPSPEFENLGEGEYVIVVKDANNCADITEVVLVAPDELAIEFETTPAECRDKADGTLTINTVVGGTMPYYINGGTSQYFDNLLPGDFVIELIDGNDCRLIDTAYIEALRMSCLSLPNAFTPNGDGANDKWILDDDENGVNDMYLYPDAELRVYNRWGELVYYSNSVADEPWDGTYRGRDLPMDSYHYVLDLGNDDPPIIGSITIIR